MAAPRDGGDPTAGGRDMGAVPFDIDLAEIDGM
ncbi:hypothetical protein HNR25_001612 [Streptomonospora salina]|uniref:Uncharacterized protein n=1 Tax=Streptomonospora salina TaxID=104205 RepID=A0A841EEK7_9ACTN|nr:hypothetical protein [Streptomonospora salina]